MNFLQDNTQLANHLSKSLMLGNDGEGKWVEHGHVLMPEYSSNYIYPNGKHLDTNLPGKQLSPPRNQRICLGAPEVVTTARSNSLMNQRPRSDPTPRKRSSTISSCKVAPETSTSDKHIRTPSDLPHLTPSDPNEYSDSSSSPSPALDQSSEWGQGRLQFNEEYYSLQSLARRPLPDLKPENLGDNLELTMARSREVTHTPFKRNRSPTRVHTEGGQGSTKSRWPTLVPVSLDAGIPPEVPPHRTQSVSLASSWGAVLAGSTDQRRSPEYMPSGIYTRKCSYRATPAPNKAKLERSTSEAPRKSRGVSNNTPPKCRSTAADDICKPSHRFALDGYQEGCALRVMNPDSSDGECEDEDQTIPKPRYSGTQIIESSTFCEVRRRESQQRSGQNNTYFVPSKAFLAEYDEDDDDEFDFDN